MVFFYCYNSDIFPIFALRKNRHFTAIVCVKEQKIKQLV